MSHPRFVPFAVVVGALALALAGAGAAAVRAQDTATPPSGVRVVGLAVAQPTTTGDSFGGSLANGLMPGVGLHLRIERPDATLLSVDADASKLVAFTDDRGTDLAGRDQWLWPFAEPTEDGHVCVVQVRSDSVPAAGARELRLKGSIALRTGADPRVTEAKDVVLREGTTIDAGFAKWTVKNAERDGGGLSVTLESETSFDRVRKLEFVGSDGRAVAAEERGGWGFSTDGKGQWSKDYALERAASKVTVRVSWWGRFGTLEVPVDLRAGVGL